MSIRIVRKKASNGARILKEALACKMQPLRTWSRIFPRKDKLIINWGNTQNVFQNLPLRVKVLNRPGAVANAVNKDITLDLLKRAEVLVPDTVTTLPAKEQRRGEIWIARTLLTSHSGQGIVVIRDTDDAVPAPLYTKYVKKKIELRMHVIAGRVVKVAERKKRSGYEHTADQLLIRSYDNGWVHVVNNVAPYPEEADTVAIAAVAALGLDFGAVDLVIEKGTERVFVLEVNTAPGLSSPTVIKAYADTFQEIGE